MFFSSLRHRISLDCRRLELGPPSEGGLASPECSFFRVSLVRAKGIRRIAVSPATSDCVGGVLCNGQCTDERNRPGELRRMRHRLQRFAALFERYVRVVLRAGWLERLQWCVSRLERRRRELRRPAASLVRMARCVQVAKCSTTCGPGNSTCAPGAAHGAEYCAALDRDVDNCGMCRNVVRQSVPSARPAPAAVRIRVWSSARTAGAALLASTPRPGSIALRWLRQCLPFKPALRGGGLSASTTRFRPHETFRTVVTSSSPELHARDAGHNRRRDDPTRRDRL